MGVTSRYIPFMPEALVDASGALLGVIVGALLTYAFTRRAQVAKSLHDTRIAAFARFAVAIMEYRRALMERWFVENGAPATSADGHRVHEARSAAWAAMFEVQLLTADAAVGRLARDAVDRTAAIKDAGDRATLASLGDESRTRVEEFVTAARGDIAAERSVR